MRIIPDLFVFISIEERCEKSEVANSVELRATSITPVYSSYYAQNPFMNRVTSIAFAILDTNFDLSATISLNLLVNLEFSNFY